jgi:hypothetical protein
MNEHNICLMFAPSLFRSRGNALTELKYLGTKVDLCKLMMNEYDNIFTEAAVDDP